MYGMNLGVIYIDNENQDKFPAIESTKGNIWFEKTNELFEMLENNSAFGRGKFKISDYNILHNITYD